MVSCQREPVTNISCLISSLCDVCSKQVSPSGEQGVEGKYRLDIAFPEKRRNLLSLLAGCYQAYCSSDDLMRVTQVATTAKYSHYGVDNSGERLASDLPVKTFCTNVRPRGK